MNAMMVQGVAAARQRAVEVGISNPEMAGVDGTKLMILIVVVAAIVAAILVARYMMKKRGLSVASIISSKRSESVASASQQPRATKYCADCGAPMAQGMKFCPKCGRRLG